MTTSIRNSKTPEGVLAEAATSQLAGHSPQPTARESGENGSYNEVSSRVRLRARLWVRTRLAKPRRLVALTALVAAAILLLWWAIAHFSGINSVLLPSPGEVFQQLIDANRCRVSALNATHRECGVQGYFLWQHLLATVQRILVGLFAGLIVGVTTALLLSRNRIFRSIVEPYLSFLRALPPLGYIGLLIVWFGIGDVSKVMLLFLATFPVIAVTTLSAIIGIPHDWELAARTLGANSFQVFRRVTVPGILPELVNGIRLANGISWSCIVAAEMNDGIPGIGGLAYISGTQLQTALTIACIIVIGVCAVAIDSLLLHVERRLAPWRRKR